MFPASYFSAFYFTGFYWPKVGAASLFNPAWASGSNRVIGFTIEPS